MENLLKALKALERLGAEWKARRVSKKFLFDTIECATLVQTNEGVVRGLVEIQQREDYCQTKAEVACYLDGKLDDKGEFKHAKHPKSRIAKLYEYQGEVLFRYSTVFGIGLGWNPRTLVSEEHQYLISFAEQMVVKFDCEKAMSKAANATENDASKIAYEAKARRALFG